MNASLKDTLLRDQRFYLINLLYLYLAVCTRNQRFSYLSSTCRNARLRQHLFKQWMTSISQRDWRWPMMIKYFNLLIKKIRFLYTIWTLRNRMIKLRIILNWKTSAECQKTTNYDKAGALRTSSSIQENTDYMQPTEAATFTWLTLFLGALCLQLK